MFAQLFVACWVALGIVWLVARLSQKRTAERQDFWGSVSWLPLYLLGFVLLWLGIRGPLDARILPATTAIQATGLLLTITGLVLATWARIILGRNWSATVALKEGHELIQEGPYALVRHPIYTALILMYLGTALALGTGPALLGFLPFAVSFWIKLKAEERLMLKAFGKRYEAYKQAVKALVPGLF